MRLRFSVRIFPAPAILRTAITAVDAQLHAVSFHAIFLGQVFLHAAGYVGDTAHITPQSDHDFVPFLWIRSICAP